MTKQAYVKQITELITRAIDEHGETIVRVPCEHGGCDHGVVSASEIDDYVWLHVNEFEFLNE